MFSLKLDPEGRSYQHALDLLVNKYWSKMDLLDPLQSDFAERISALDEHWNAEIAALDIVKGNYEFVMRNRRVLAVTAIPALMIGIPVGIATVRYLAKQRKYWVMRNEERAGGESA